VALDYYGVQMPKQAAPLMKYAERLFARPAFSEAMTSAERGCANEAARPPA
jgi:RNA polymerase-associated protein